MPEFDGHFQTENIPPFIEAVDWFLERQIVTPDQFARLSAEMRQWAFTAARVYEADQLLAVYDALFAALYQGGVYADFSKAVQGIITNPWHRRTVFNTNILSAYGRGHWEQAQATKALRPWATFRVVIDGRTSPGCYRLNGVTMPLDSAYVRANWCPRHHN